MEECSQKRRFICERSATRHWENKEELPSVKLTSYKDSGEDFLDILKADLIPELENARKQLGEQQTYMRRYREVHRAISYLRSGLWTMSGIADVNCKNLIGKNNDVLVLVRKLLQEQLALPSHVLEMPKIADMIYFAKKLQKRHLEIQSLLSAACP